MPPLKGLVLVEYFHRLVAFLATLFIVYNAWRSWRKRRGDTLARHLAIWSVVLLIIQSALGALIVVLKLPGWFTTVDVSNSLVLLAVLSALTAVGVQEVRDRKGTAAVSDLPADGTDSMGTAQRAQALRQPVAWTTVLIFTQTVIGGYFRHSGDSQALFGQNSYLLSHGQHAMPALGPSALWLVAHMGFTGIVAAAIVWVVVVAVKGRMHVLPAISLLVLTAYQAALGIVSLATKLALSADTLHWAGAAVMVAISSYLWMLVTLEKAKPARVA